MVKATLSVAGVVALSSLLTIGVAPLAYAKIAEGVPTIEYFKCQAGIGYDKNQILQHQKIIRLVYADTAPAANGSLLDVLFEDDKFEIIALVDANIRIIFARKSKGAKDGIVADSTVASGPRDNGLHWRQDPYEGRLGFQIECYRTPGGKD
jgi:hypothetical protein